MNIMPSCGRVAGAGGPKPVGAAIGQGDGAIETGRHLFAILDSATKAETLRRGQMREFANGAYLIHQGEKAGGIHIITSGTVESLYESAVGRSLILATWQAGDFVGGPYVFGDHEHAWSARALGAVEALYLGHERLMAFISESVPFALALIECLGFKGERYSRLAQTLATHTTTERLALLLAELAWNCPRSDDGQVRVGSITQSKLAHMIGATRQAVGRALQKLEESGAIAMEPTSIAIVDPDILSQIGRG